MPYIPASERHQLDGYINQIVTTIRSLGGEDLTQNDGRLNYTICKILIGVLGLVGDMRYHKANTMVGILESVKLELTRRLTNIYEDSKIKSQGDII